MERATKLIVFGWACAALALEVHLVARGWGELQTIVLCAFIGAAVLSACSRKAIALVLVFTYLFPVLIRAFHGEYHPYFGTLWMAPLLGVLAPDSVTTSWHIPRRWRGSLVCWALIIAAGAPIVMWRELDFHTGLLNWPGIVWSSVQGGPGPGEAVKWILYVALVLSLGILWFDWLFLFRDSDVDFHRYVATPLLVSAAVMALVALYQMFVNIGFLNETLFGGMGRASGTLFDANLCGTVAALWIGGSLLWANGLKRWRLALAAGAATLSWLAVWASGSRTAFVAALLISGFSLVGVYFNARRVGAGFLRPLILAAVVVSALVVLANSGGPAVGPLGRLMGMLPRPSAQALRQFAAEELWNRNRYGSIATTMIRKFPLFGVGVGSFQIIMPDFANASGGVLTPDNAQNWYRHQIAEFGLIGSLGWIVWLAAFAGFVLRPRADPAKALPTWTGRGILIAFAAISFVGMPGQDVTIAMTLWTFAYWFVAEAGTTERTAPLGRRSWMLIASVVLVYAMGTATYAATRLRVPHRAQDAGWPYSYGFYDPDPGQTGDQYRWTAKRGVAVISAPTRWIQLRVRSNFSDIAAKPMDVKVWRDGNLVLQTRLTNTEPVTQYVFINKIEPWVLLETWVSRVVRPSDLGATDDRELGVLVSWSFVPALPVGATGVIVDRAR